MANSDGRWVVVATVAELRRRRSLVVDRPDGPDGGVAVFWHDDGAYALANICVHKKRELSRGTVFKSRVVCPGHQWAFDLATGWCAEREETQPAYRIRIDGDRVLLDLSGPFSLPTSP